MTSPLPIPKYAFSTARRGRANMVDSKLMQNLRGERRGSKAGERNCGRPSPKPMRSYSRPQHIQSHEKELPQTTCDHARSSSIVQPGKLKRSTTSQAFGRGHLRKSLLLIRSMPMPWRSVFGANSKSAASDPSTFGGSVGDDGRTRFSPCTRARNSITTP